MIQRFIVAFTLAALLAPIAMAQEDLAALEQRAKDYYKKRAYTRPAGENVIDVCKQIIGQDPTNATAIDLLTKVTGFLIRLGNRKLESRDYRNATGLFRKALSLDSENRKARQGLAAARAGLAKQSFKVERGKSAEYYMARGNELFDQGDYILARKYYQEILRLMPGDPLASRREAECAEHLGVKPKTQKGPMASEEERLKYWRQAAGQMIATGDYDGAVGYLRRILALRPGDQQAKKSMEKAEDSKMGAGRIALSLTGDPFVWKAKTRKVSDTKDRLAITVSFLVDGKEAGSFTDAEVESLKLGDLSANELHLPADFSVRVKKPGDNKVTVRIEAGSRKPKMFEGHVQILLKAGDRVGLVGTGSSSLEYGGTFIKKMNGDYTLELAPAE